MIYKNHMGETVEKYQYELFLREFISESQLLVNEHMKQFLFGCELSVNEGRRYDKIVASDDNDAKSTRVWAFIDKTNGNILKPATWKAPAKHPRGNIYEDDCMQFIGPYGPAYMNAIKDYYGA
tara:strand:+ start:500 stop:868 length:369 start_codon:yes stop_codon:yes gene_type:complete